jgi:hypothetical protein
MRSLRNARNGDVIRGNRQDLPPQMTTVPSSPPRPQGDTYPGFTSRPNMNMGQKRPREEDDFEPYAPLPNMTQRIPSAQLMPPPARRVIVREPKYLGQFTYNETSISRNRTAAPYSPEASFSVRLAPVRQHSVVSRQGQNSQYRRTELSSFEEGPQLIRTNGQDSQNRDVRMVPTDQGPKMTQTPQRQTFWNGHHSQSNMAALIPPSTPINPSAYTPRTSSRTYPRIPDFYQNPHGARLTMPPREASTWDTFQEPQSINENSQFLPLQTPRRTSRSRLNSTPIPQRVHRADGSVRNTLNSLSFMNEPYNSLSRPVNAPVRLSDRSPVYHQRREETEYFSRPPTQNSAAAFSYASQNPHLNPKQGVWMYGSSSSDRNPPNYPANTASLRGYGRTLTGVDHSTSTRAGPLRNAIRSSMGVSASGRRRMIR